MKKLTKKQLEVLDYIAKYTRTENRPPTIQEIADKFDIKSSTAFSHITALIRKNKLTKDRMSPRSIKLVKKDKNYLSSYFIREDDGMYYLMKYNILEDKEEIIAAFEGDEQYKDFMADIGYGRVEQEVVRA